MNVFLEMKKAQKAIDKLDEFRDSREGDGCKAIAQAILALAIVIDAKSASLTLE